MGSSRTLKGELISFPLVYSAMRPVFGHKLLSSASDEPSSPECHPKLRDAHAHPSRPELGTEGA